MYTIIADEVTDKYSNKEIMSLCLRFMDSGKIKDISLDFIALERTTGEKIAEAILLLLKSNNIDIAKARRGQAYDGTGSMLSERVGVKAGSK